nr:MAG TPA: hypothetical protein [Caudoviricetes sp.]
MWQAERRQGGHNICNSRTAKRKSQGKNILQFKIRKNAKYHTGWNSSI